MSDNGTVEATVKEAPADVATPIIKKRIETMKQQRQQGQQQIDALLQQRQGIDQKLNELSKMDWALAGSIAQLEATLEEIAEAEAD